MNTTFRNANSKVYNAVLVPMVEHKRLQSIHETVSLLYKYNRLIDNIEYGRDIYIFPIWVFFHEYSRMEVLHGKEEGISLAPQYHFHQLHRHLDILNVSGAVTAESSPLYIDSRRT